MIFFCLSFLRTHSGHAIYSDHSVQCRIHYAIRMAQCMWREMHAAQLIQRILIMIPNARVYTHCAFPLPLFIPLFYITNSFRLIKGQILFKANCKYVGSVPVKMSTGIDIALAAFDRVSGKKPDLWKCIKEWGGVGDMDQQHTHI